MIKTKFFSWYYFGVALVVLVAGIVSSLFVFTTVSKIEQDSLLKNAASVASVLDTSSILSLSGSENDLKNPVYISIKNKLEKITKANNDVRFVYLWGYRDGGLYFMVDSEVETSSDYSPPGQVYGEATAVDLAMFTDKLPSAIEMSTDRWGTWFSALMPIKDPNSGALIAVMGMDMSASRYFRTIYAYTAIPVITMFFLLILIGVGLVLRRREQELLAFKSELISIASHEIRSPLTGMSWLIDDLLKGGDNMSQKQKEDVGRILNKSKGLLVTINNLLDGSVAEKMNKNKLVKEPIHMKMLFEEIKNDSSLILEEKNIRFNIDVSVTSELIIPGDHDRIKRMFNNLVSNAIKYSKNGGFVMAGAINNKKSTTFWIRDEGVGISGSDKSKIFKGFFRAENAKKITNNGTGLGLRYVEQIVELHGGKVWCESKENVGSTFFIELPR